MTYEQQLREWTQLYGLSFSLYKGPIKGHAFQGKTHIKVGIDRSRQHALHDVCHELAHYVVADPKRRTQPNYGLGTGPADSCTWGCDFCKRTVPTKDARDEEERASLLGLLMVAHCDGLENALEEFDEHSWQARDALNLVRKWSFVKYVHLFQMETGVNLLDLTHLLSVKNKGMYSLIGAKL